MRRPESAPIAPIVTAFAALLLSATILRGQTIRGVVRDVIANRPLRDALVQLVRVDAASPQARSTHADSLGRYEFSDVTSGRYLIGFIHPLLDSLGVPPLANEVRVEHEPLVVNLATPEPSKLRVAFCGSSADSGGVITGVVRDTHHDPLGGATISAEWMELSIGGGMQARTNVARRATTSLANGWFFVCNLPAAGTVFLSAARSRDTTDAIEIAIPNGRLAHHDLYVGGRATARVSGVVIGPDNEPVANAVVRAAGGSEARANARGEWTLPDAPGGTRTIEFRAIGYYPQRVSVDLVDDAPPMRVSLPTMGAMLDTVRIRAARNVLSGANGFDQRRRSSTGYFFTAEEITRIAPRMTSDLFRRVPGTTVDRSSFETAMSGTGTQGPHQLTMPGTFTDRCTPSVFVDGSYLGDLDADDIDSFVGPRDIAGVEIYTRPPLPPQFEQGNHVLGYRGQPKDPCGAIAIWTNTTHEPPMSWRSFAGKVFAVSAVVSALLLVSFR